MGYAKPSARIFIAGDLGPGLAVTPERAQGHYLTHVMRLAEGDAVALFNGRDGEWRAVIAGGGRHAVTLACETQTRPQRAEPDVWLAFAPLKKTPTDFLIEKTTELGVSRLIPVFTRHTATERVKVERLRAHAIEAAEQCERLSVPEVAEPVTLERLLAEWPAGRTLLVLDETGGGAPIAAALAENATTPPCHGILIGPEGGFSFNELDALRKLAFVTPVGVGPRILRAETAALAALSCWQALVGDWR
ncbi:MAG: 16S rRNA (uracil(1498)-N(3))-methyltransferase [Rhodospirillales bacterium]|nr:16S rRNA (uracil(1498)-N(3))-methyltransferase [Rhodospirillales bacterium]